MIIRFYLKLNRIERIIQFRLISTIQLLIVIHKLNFIKFIHDFVFDTPIDRMVSNDS